MANVVGSAMVVEDIDFSIYFSRKNSSHSTRLKIVWNNAKMTGQGEGYLYLHGDYRYQQSSHQKFNPDATDIATARYFAKRYKVLFAAVWENCLDENVLGKFFKGKVSWDVLVNSFYNINSQVCAVLSNCRNLKDLEYAVRKNKAFNMND